MPSGPQSKAIGSFTNGSHAISSTRNPGRTRIDLEDAYHPQTIAAHRLNDAPLPVANGAAVRMRIERKLGYKHAKYVHTIEVVDSYAAIAGGRGGFWEDRNYDWYAGI